MRRNGLNKEQCAPPSLTDPFRLLCAEAQPVRKHVNGCLRPVAPRNMLYYTPTDKDCQTTNVFMVNSNTIIVLQHPLAVNFPPVQTHRKRLKPF